MRVRAQRRRKTCRRERECTYDVCTGKRGWEREGGDRVRERGKAKRERAEREGRQRVWEQDSYQSESEKITFHQDLQQLIIPTPNVSPFRSADHCAVIQRHRLNWFLPELFHKKWEFPQYFSPSFSHVHYEWLLWLANLIRG